MEDSQRRLILDNLHKLVRITECSALFLTYLVQHKVFSDDDIYLLESESNKFEKNHRMYRILITRSQSFEVLCKAFEETHQSGPLDILTSMHISATVRGIEKLQKVIKNLKLEPRWRATLAKLQVPSLPKYYIKRSLTSRYNLQKEILQTTTKAVFVVEGMQKHVLTSLADGNSTDNSGNQIDGLTVRHITMDCKQDYYTICKLSPDPVHWIKYTEKTGKLKLVQSSQTVSVPQEFVHKTQEGLTERELSLKTGNVVIIAGSPGAGKTMLLSSIAQYKIRQEPNSLVFFLVMKDLVERYRRLWFLDIMRGQETINLVIEAILVNEKSGLSPKRVIGVKEQMTLGNCTIFLDGFDEVCKPNLRIAKEILSSLRNLKLTRLFVTTRLHMLADLENDLVTLGFTLDIFNETDQTNLLVGVWESKGILQYKSLRDLASSFLTVLAHKMNDFEREIVGIPLQCKIFAEVCSNRASRQGVKYDEKPAASVSIFELYKRLVDLRISNNDKRYKSIIQNHMCYALRLLFPEAYLYVDDIEPKNPPILENHMLRLGILEKGKTGEMQFVHHTLAEYFVAWFVVDQKWGDLPLSGNILLANIVNTTEIQIAIKTPVGRSNTLHLFTFRYPEICFFINGFMKDRCQQHIDTNNFHSMLTNNYIVTEPLLIASAFHKLSHFPYVVARFQKKTNHNEDVEAATFSKTMFNDLLITTVLYADVEMMKLFGSCPNINILRAEMKTDSNSFAITPLHIAIKRGNYVLVEYLAGKYEPVLTTLRFLFHFCVFESEGDSRSTIENKKEIIKLLSAKSNQWLIEPLEDGRIPLTQRKVHLDLVICLYQETQKI